MGASASVLTTADIVAELENLGPAYVKKYATLIEDSGVDGKVLAMLKEHEVDECFQDLEITSIIHRKKIKSHFQEKYGAIASSDAGPPSPSKRGGGGGFDDKDGENTPGFVVSGDPMTPGPNAAAESNQASDEPTDAFFTHNWGPDSEGRDNHQRVALVVKEMQNRGLGCWFDSERMTGAVRRKMTTGIDNTKCMIIFITNKYKTKVIDHIYVPCCAVMCCDILCTYPHPHLSPSSPLTTPPPYPHLHRSTAKTTATTVGTSSPTAWSKRARRTWCRW
jgi:hypothetical protein